MAAVAAVQVVGECQVLPCRQVILLRMSMLQPAASPSCCSPQGQVPAYLLLKGPKEGKVQPGAVLAAALHQPLGLRWLRCLLPLASPHSVGEPRQTGLVT